MIFWLLFVLALLLYVFLPSLKMYSGLLSPSDKMFMFEYEKKKYEKNKAGRSRTRVVMLTARWLSTLEGHCSEEDKHALCLIFRFSVGKQ